MSVNVIRAIGAAFGAALVALGNSGVPIPLVDGAMLAQLGTLILGWVGLRQPGTVERAEPVQ
jgi:hypothetical protein